MRNGFWKGLKAIELAIAACVVAILLAVVYLRFDAISCRAMHSEAKFALKEIYAAQKLYHAKHDRYAPLEKLHIEDGRVVILEKYYQLSDQERPGQDSFLVVARGVKGTMVADELWTIDQHNNLVQKKGTCAAE